MRVGPWSGLLRSDGDDDEDAVAPRDRRSSTQSQVQRDIGDALNVYLELRRAQLPATATASLLLDRCTFLAKTYARPVALSTHLPVGPRRRPGPIGRAPPDVGRRRGRAQREIRDERRLGLRGASARRSGARASSALRARRPGPPAAEPAAAHGGRVRLRAPRPRRPAPPRRARRRPRRRRHAAGRTPCWRRRRRRRTTPGRGRLRGDDARCLHGAGGADTGARLMPSFAPQPRAPPGAAAGPRGRRHL